MLATRTAVVVSCSQGTNGPSVRRAPAAGALKDSRRDVLRLACVLAGSAFFLPNSADAVECSIITPCMIMPKDGKPRYDMPGSQYDPAKEAERRYKEKMEAKIAAEAAAAPKPAAVSK